MGTLPVEVGKCVSSDVITSFLDGVNGRGKAVDVIAWSTGTAGGRVSADIITSRGSIDVIRSSVDGGNANVPGGTHGGSRRGTIDVITSLLGGGRVGIDVITSFTGGGRVGTAGSWNGNIDVMTSFLGGGRVGIDVTD